MSPPTDQEATRSRAQVYAGTMCVLVPSNMAWHRAGHTGLLRSIWPVGALPELGPDNGTGRTGSQQAGAPKQGWPVPLWAGNRALWKPREEMVGGSEEGWDLPCHCLDVTEQEVEQLRKGTGWGGWGLRGRRRPQVPADRDGREGRMRQAQLPRASSWCRRKTPRKEPSMPAPQAQSSSLPRPPIHPLTTPTFMVTPQDAPLSPEEPPPHIHLAHSLLPAGTSPGREAPSPCKMITAPTPAWHASPSLPQFPSQSCSCPSRICRSLPVWT